MAKAPFGKMGKMGGDCDKMMSGKSTKKAKKTAPRGFRKSARK